MNEVRDFQWTRPARRVASAVLCLLVLGSWLSACSDGYPTEDAPQINPASMTQAQLLAAMNALGREPDLGKRWRYALHDDCELEVWVQDGNTVHRRVTLEGAEVETRSADGISEIRLVPSAGDDDAVTVLETPRWTDTVMARSLLTHLEVRCGRPEGPVA